MATRKLANSMIGRNAHVTTENRKQKALRLQRLLLLRLLLLETVETAAPDEDLEAVETVAPDNALGTVKTAAPDEDLEAVETVALDNALETVETAAPDEDLEAVETVAPDNALGTVKTAAPDEDLDAVKTVALDNALGTGKTAALEEDLEAVETVAPDNALGTVKTAALEEDLEAVETVALDNALGTAPDGDLDAVETITLDNALGTGKTAALEEDPEAVETVALDNALGTGKTAAPYGDLVAVETIALDNALGTGKTAALEEDLGAAKSVEDLESTVASNAKAIADLKIEPGQSIVDMFRLDEDRLVNINAQDQKMIKQSANDMNETKTQPKDVDAGHQTLVQKVPAMEIDMAVSDADNEKSASKINWEEVGEGAVHLASYAFQDKYHNESNFNALTIISFSSRPISSHRPQTTAGSARCWPRLMETMHTKCWSRPRPWPWPPGPGAPTLAIWSILAIWSPSTTGLSYLRVGATTTPPYLPGKEQFPPT